MLVILTFSFFGLGYYLVGSYLVPSEGFSLAISIDNSLPLISEFVFIYISMYIVAILPYFFIKDRKQFTRVISAYLLILTISFMIFIFFPVYVPRPELVINSFSDRVLNYLYLIDLPINNFPSLHVALTTLSSLILYQYSKRIGSLALIWTSLIALSVLFVKQHYFLDIVSGVLVAGIGYLYYSQKSYKVSSKI